jgi:hypothetical protein
MKRSVEFGFIVALSALTALATMTVLHDAQRGWALDQWIAKGVHAVFGRDLQAAKPAAEAEPKTQAQSAPQATQPQSSGDEPQKTLFQASQEQSQQPAAGTWNAQDVAQLQEMATRVFGDMSADDWQTLMRAVTDSSGQDSSAAFAAVLNRHLTDDDRRWIAEHFSGRQAFDGEDVQLLQRMYAEILAELTPDEQSMLANQLQNLVKSGFDLHP